MRLLISHRFECCIPYGRENHTSLNVASRLDDQTATVRLVSTPKQAPFQIEIASRLLKPNGFDYCVPYGNPNHAALTVASRVDAQTATFL